MFIWVLTKVQPEYITHHGKFQVYDRNIYILCIIVVPEMR